MVKENVFACIVTTAYLGFMALLVMLICAFIYIAPVQVTVDEASLEHLAVAAPAGNATASLAYNLSLVVTVHNPNWVVRVWRTSPLDAELRFGGGPFALVRLAGAGEQESIGAGTSKVYRVAVAAESAPVGSDGVAAFARENAIGVFGLELIVAGEFKYQAVIGRYNTSVRCPLRIPLATSATAAAFADFEHTALPQPCVDARVNRTRFN